MMQKMGFGEFSGGGKGLSDQALLAELGGSSEMGPKGSGIDDMIRQLGLN